MLYGVTALGEAFQQRMGYTYLLPLELLDLSWFPGSGLHIRSQHTRPYMHPGVPGRSRSALRHGVRHDAQDLEHQIGPIEGGVARRVERGRHLTDIPPNELQPPQPP